MKKLMLAVLLIASLNSCALLVGGAIGAGAAIAGIECHKHNCIKKTKDKIEQNKQENNELHEVK